MLPDNAEEINGVTVRLSDSTDDRLKELINRLTDAHAADLTDGNRPPIEVGEDGSLNLHLEQESTTRETVKAIDELMQEFEYEKTDYSDALYEGKIIPQANMGTREGDTPFYLNYTPVE